MTIARDLTKASYQKWQGDEYNYYRNTSFSDYTIIGKATDFNASIPASTEINIRLLPDGKVMFSGLFTATAAIAPGDAPSNPPTSSPEGQRPPPTTNANGDTTGQNPTANGNKKTAETAAKSKKRKQGYLK